jgi:hypothetical protein
MQTTFLAFAAAHAKERRYGAAVDPATVTQKQLRNYAASRIETVITPRTIQTK